MTDYETGAEETDADRPYENAVSADNHTVTETLHFSDGSTLVAQDPFRPIDASDVTDTTVTRRELSTYRDV